MTTDSEIPAGVTFREVQEILRTFTASGWTGMRLEVRGMTITVGKEGSPALAGSSSVGAATAATAPTATPATAPAPQVLAPGTAAAGPGGAPATGATPAAGISQAGTPTPAGPPRTPSAPLDTTGLVEVRSPAVGAFWVAPSPGQPPFVEVGQAVGEHEQLAIVEVMKLMNPVVASEAGEIVQVCAANAEMVEYDQVLFLIRPGDG
jgi:acetyl-CoA carboxylase biotin carboxyl carrier protein